MINCKYCTKSVKNDVNKKYYCQIIYRMPQYHFGEYFSIQECDIRNIDNNCKFFNDNLIYKIKQFFRRIFGI